MLLATFKRVEAQLRAVPVAVPFAQEITDLIFVLERGKPPRTIHRVRVVHRKVAPQPIPQRIQVEPDPVGEKLAAGSGARALLLEILRRAAYDWVLYRDSTRLEHKVLAEDAYTWLFQEDEDHPHWRARCNEGKHLTAFVAICEEIDLDPDVVRRAVKGLTLNRVVASGRPPTRTKQRGDSSEEETSLCLPLALVESSFEDAGY